MNTPVQLWRRAAAQDPARPFVTSYDGGRVELSYATFDNWVAKTANLLVDGLGAGPGDRVVLALPLHWQSLAWLLACWSAGLAAVPAADGPLPQGEVVAAGPAQLDAALESGAPDVVGLSLDPLGAPLRQRPEDVVDYAVEVRAFADRFSPAQVPGPGSAALVADRSYSGGELAAAAADRSAAWGLTPADRVAIITPSGDPLPLGAEEILSVLACLAGSSSMVITSGTDSPIPRTLSDEERLTAALPVRPDSASATASVPAEDSALRILS